VSIRGRAIARAWPALFILAGCTLLPPQPDRSRFFILTAASDGAQPIALSVADPNIAVGVGPVGLPGYLKRPELVTRVGSDQLQLSDEERWAEPLDSNFQRVLGQDLSQMLGTQRIVMFPWYGRTRIDYQVEVQVHRFDAGADGQSQLTARWIVLDGKSGAELAAEETTTNASVTGGNAGVPAALSRDLSAFSRQIAERIAELSQARAKKLRSEGRSGGQ